MMGRSKSQERIPVKLRRQTVQHDTMQYLKVKETLFVFLSVCLSICLPLYLSVSIV
jgi:hypothetical protein